MSGVEQSGTFALGDRQVRRLGFGAMQLSGPGIFGPPTDRKTALAVLREAVSSGVNHIDTSDYYGPHITNQLIREALHILLIPGTSSLVHLRENMTAATLRLPDEAFATLNELTQGRA